MKKTLAAVAVLSAFATSAFAAEVTIYGRVGTGFLLHDYESTKFDGVKTDATDFSMDSGVTTTNRLGFKGSEKISEDLEVGFVLETKLLTDSGTAFAEGFDRESLIYAKTNYGNFYAGKVGAMWSDGGSTAFWAANYVAGGTGGGGYSVQGIGLMSSQMARVSNRISYISPTFAGFTLYGEYSFGVGYTDPDDPEAKAKLYDEENSSYEDRPAAIGLKYANGPFGAGMVLTYKNEATLKKGAAGAVDTYTDQEDEFTVNLGTNYNFGFANVKLAGQYFTGSDSIGNVTTLAKVADSSLPSFDDLKGYALVAGADIPAWGGTWTVSVAYTDAEDDASARTVNTDFMGFNVGAMYTYPLSKQTFIKAGAGYLKVEAERSNETHKAEYETIDAWVGLVQYF